MLLHIVLASEILSSLICMHCLHGKKIKLEKGTVLIVILLFFILEAINLFQWNYLTTIISHVVIFIYCKKKFQVSITETVVSFVLYILIMTSVQFCFGIAANAVFYQNKAICYFARSILTLLFCIGILPKCRLPKLCKIIYENKGTMYRILSIISMIVFIILLTGKIRKLVQLQYFIFVVPCIVVVLHLLLKWGDAAAEAGRLAKRLSAEERGKENFNKLLAVVRMRQHAYKNHLTAILSTHYTYKTYEQMVEAQNQYCKQMQAEDRYTKLLLLSDKIIAGYLYEKIQEAERYGVTVRYIVTAFLDHICVPAYQVIEMLGILLDNAVDAVKQSRTPEVFIEIAEQDSGYGVSVRNPYEYVPYQEIQSWFQFGKSQKGDDRGVGLYQLKQICCEWECALECRNIEYENVNWIVFTVKIKKQTAA